MTYTKLTTLLIAACSLTSVAQAGILAYSLPGITEVATWNDLNGSNYSPPTYNTFGPSNTNGWLAPISNTGGSMSADFDKTAGFGGHPGSASIYTFTSTGQWTITDGTAPTGIQTLIFQIDMLSGITIPPSLTYNSGAGTVFASQTEQWAGGFSFPGFGDTTNYVFEFDLSGLSVTDYTINWSSTPHTAIFAMRLDSTDAATSVVPEPSTYGAMAGAAALMFCLLRRRKSVSQ